MTLHHEDDQLRSNDDEVPADVLALHPIIVALAQGFENGVEGADFAPLSEVAFTELVILVRDLANGDDSRMELLHVAESLSALANILRTEHGSEQLADQIVACVGQEAVVQSLLELSASTDPEAVHDIAERFDGFSARKRPKTAPKVGDSKPEGVVDLNALNFPKRL